MTHAKISSDWVFHAKDIVFDAIQKIVDKIQRHFEIKDYEVCKYDCSLYLATLPCSDAVIDNGKT